MLTFDQVLAECFAALTDDHRLAITSVSPLVVNPTTMEVVSIPSPRRVADMVRFGGNPFPKWIDEGQFKHIFRAFCLEVLPEHRAEILKPLPTTKLNKKRFGKLVPKARSGLVLNILNTYYNSKAKPMWWPVLRGSRSEFMPMKKPGQFADPQDIAKTAIIFAELCYDAQKQCDKLPMSWRTDAVLSLLKVIRSTEDFTAFPILADALQEAGCENTVLLDHCRSSRRKSLGSWLFKAVGLA